MITMASCHVVILVELCKTSHDPAAAAAAAVVNSDVMTVLPDHVSRPHVLMESEQQGRSSFTSQYVANHLQDLIASPSGMLAVNLFVCVRVHMHISILLQ